MGQQIFLSDEVTMQSVRTLTGNTMGGGWSLKFWSDERHVDQDVFQVVQFAFDTVDEQMSTYKEQSDICRFNRAEVGDWIDIPAEMGAVVAAGIDIGQRTEGALDVTLGALVDIWGFGAGPRPANAPEQSAIETALQCTGIARLEQSVDRSRIRKTAPFGLDLCALAKGHGVDLAVVALQSIGINNFIIEAAGEAFAQGLRPDGGAWVVGVELPVPDKIIILSRIGLRANAVASSGKYRNVWADQNTTHSHLIDAGTGMPMQDPLLSVSVVHRCCMHADAMATALLAMGADRGREYAKDNDIAALFAIRSDEGFWQIATGEFEAFCLP